MYTYGKVSKAPAGVVPLSTAQKSVPARRAVSATTDREVDYDSRISDHSPVVVDYHY